MLAVNSVIYFPPCNKVKRGVGCILESLVRVSNIRYGSVVVLVCVIVFFST